MSERPLYPKGSSSRDYDLICVGFGPASLAVAIALYDKYESTLSLASADRSCPTPPKVLFLDRTSHFTWHGGMQLPDAKMQITFLKDLATFRNPRSAFTFINYLHAHRRLAKFTNLSTFLPLRAEYEDYMRWCAEPFNDCVEWCRNVLHVSPIVDDFKDMVKSFEVTSHNESTGATEKRRAKHVVIAAGGRLRLPEAFPQGHSRMIHSSQYLPRIHEALPVKDQTYDVAVIGAGQSAAEIFVDLQKRYPSARTRLFIRGGALRPSDDSPFVNEVFDPSRVNSTYASEASTRVSDMRLDRSTNYGVVRLELLEHMYAALYHQRIEYGKRCRLIGNKCETDQVGNEDDEEWMQHRILPYRNITRVEDCDPSGIDRDHRVRLHVENTSSLHGHYSSLPSETFDADAVIVACGYSRDAYEGMLAPCGHLRPRESPKWSVQRDYRVRFREGTVDEAGVGIWLQGSCEETHGLSDTLLSILATRAGEMVDSIFGKR
ncbi:MAG: hypothetical protein M1828_003680 [Chrysothrix sp. TS-e1954]|nr:MAG: hypothetical protein M1828_003680 [Chrysothrix sp. TS-e1954]